MKEIWNIVKLDLLCLKKYFRLYFLLLCLAVVYTLFSHSILLGTITLSMLISVRGIGLIYEIQDKNNFDRLYGYLPVNYKKIVAGRYVSISLMCGICLLIFLFLQICISDLTGIFISKNDFILSLACGFLLLFCSIIIQLPIFYKLGIIMAKPFCLLPVVFYSIMAYIINTTTLFDKLHGHVGYIVGCFSTIVLLFLSFSISTKIYEKKEC